MIKLAMQNALSGVQTAYKVMTQDDADIARPNVRTRDAGAGTSDVLTGPAAPLRWSNCA